MSKMISMSQVVACTITVHPNQVHILMISYGPYMASLLYIISQETFDFSLNKISDVNEIERECLIMLEQAY